MAAQTKFKPMDFKTDIESTLRIFWFSEDWIEVELDDYNDFLNEIYNSLKPAQIEEFEKLRANYAAAKNELIQNDAKLRAVVNDDNVRQWRKLVCAEMKAKENLSKLAPQAGSEIREVLLR